MPDQIQCPHCGQTYQLTSEQVPQYAGRTITCTQCQKPFTVPGERAPEAPAPPVPPPMPAAAPQQTAYPPPIPHYAGPQTYQKQDPNGWATASIVTACIGILIPLLPALLAVIFGILGLTKTKDPRVGGKGLAIAGICVAAFSVVMWTCGASILLPSLNRAREVANRVKCASNMRQIGQAIILYANDHRGQYPQQLEQLLVTQDITSEVFVCPQGDDTAAMPGGTPQQQAAALSTPGHLSYVYVGQNLTSSAPADSVVLYEKPGSHNNDGMNFLWGDGHVSWENGKYAQFLIAEVQAGRNPPSPYTGKP